METTSTNWERIKNDLPDLTDANIQTDVSSTMNKLRKKMDKLQNEKSENKMPKLIKYLLLSMKNQNELFDTYIDTMFNVGASMYLLALHLKVAKYIALNLPHVASNCYEGHNLASFIETPTLSNYCAAAAKDLLTKQSNIQTSDSTSKRNLKDLISERKRKQDDQEDLSQPGPSKKRKD